MITLENVNTPLRLAARMLAIVLLALAIDVVPSPHVGCAGATVTPAFDGRVNPFGLTDVGRRAAPELTDLDGDGDVDALTGDTDGVLWWSENVGSAAVPDFAPAVAYPFGLAFGGLEASPAAGDLDGDGDLDLLVGGTLGDLLLFRNTGTATAPAFAAPVTNPFGLANVGQSAAPALADFDADGDLDAVVGASSGSLFVFENVGTPIAPSFVGAENVLGLTALLGFSAPALADVDGDGLVDLLVGSGDGKIRLFANVGTATDPSFTLAGADAHGLADSGTFSSPGVADLDADGDLDVLVGNDDGNGFFYENVGTATAPRFDDEFAAPFGFVPVATFLRPAIGDLDGDGDLDLMISADPELPRLWFVENVGNAQEPVFATQADFPFGIGFTGLTNPELADIDGDGDLDLLYGSSGDLALRVNVGTPTAPAFAAVVRNPFGLASAGSAPAPTVADLDGDGDLDMVVGLANGQLRYFENVGTATAPAFVDHGTSYLGNFDVGQDAAPELVDLDQDDDLDMVVGNRDGDLWYVENTGSRTAPAFTTTLLLPFGLGNVGGFAAPVLGDIDGDGDADALVGSRSGSLLLFAGVPFVACPATPEQSCGAFAQGSLLVKETTPGKEQLAVQLKGGPALAQADFGDPTRTNGTAYALCLYDDESSLTAELVVDRPGASCNGKACWKSSGGLPPNGTGYTYKDGAASASGVKQLVLKAGAAGKSSITLKAQNNAARGQSSLPTGIADGLYSTGSVTVQLRDSNAVGCHTATLFTSTRAPGSFKAR